MRTLINDVLERLLNLSPARRGGKVVWPMDGKSRPLSRHRTCQCFLQNWEICDYWLNHPAWSIFASVAPMDECKTRPPYSVWRMNVLTGWDTASLFSVRVTKLWKRVGSTSCWLGSNSWGGGRVAKTIQAQQSSGRHWMGECPPESDPMSWKWLRLSVLT